MSILIENDRTALLDWLLATGLDEQRARLYLAALKRAKASARELADDLKLGRTAVYDNLRALAERGLVKTVHSGKRKLFVPLNPKELYGKFETQKQQLKQLLPDFLALYGAKSRWPFVQIFEGPLAAREVHENILKITKKEYVYFSPQLLALRTFAFDRRYISKWIDRRVKKGIRSRSLRVNDKTVPDAPQFNEEAKYLRQIRYLPAYMDLKSSIYIYENNVGLISTSRDGAAVIIHSPEIAFSLRQLFEFMWGISLRS